MNNNYTTLRDTTKYERVSPFPIFIIFITILYFFVCFSILNNIPIPNYVGMLLRQCILTNYIELNVRRQIFICMIKTF